MNETTLQQFYALQKAPGGWLEQCETTEAELRVLTDLRRCIEIWEYRLTRKILAGEDHKELWPSFVARVEDALSQAGQEGITPSVLRKQLSRRFPGMAPEAIASWLDHLISSGWVVLIEERPVGGGRGRNKRRCLLASQLPSNRGTADGSENQETFSWSTGLDESQELPA